ncbi:MAG TPA: polyhydroxyalkanoate synthesis regulator DNA-binding domain-containing protein [Bryobacteraceae bacterium]|jgi:polyhydroxyalkanoate synthesis repressor PhaR|nr:polyhydroxyalkanoate synthesis regulator DNA-binding domain-containing protein [Bryobacteraceae bacterium]
MSQPPKIIIKKYENRRLYDTTNSRYINLEEVAEMVRKGGEVQVVDAKTNEDLTRTVLTQIIVEETKGRELGLPLELLRQLVLASDSARHQFLEWYLKNAMEAYQKVSESLQTRFQEVQHAATNPVEAVMNLWRSNPFLGSAAPGSVPIFPWAAAAPSAPTAPKPEEPKEIDELRRRLEELEKQLKAASSKRKSGKKK